MLQEAPPFLSVQFHLRYFPSLIWQRMKPRAEERRSSSFANHGSLEYVVLTMVCAGVIAFGLPAALRGSAIGWAAAGLGSLGLIGLLIGSVLGARGAYAGFGDFRAPVFC